MTQDNDTALWHRTIWVAALVAVVLLVAACSTGSQGPGVANAGTTSPATAAAGSSGSPGSSGSAKSDALKFSQCMRAHGIADFPDPGSGGDISINGGPGSDLNPNNAAFQAAQQACKKYSPEANMTPAQKAQAQANLLKYAQCMRAHGIADFPDPGNGPNGGLGFQIKGGPGSDLDPNNSTFAAAQRACQKNLPGGKNGSGGLQIRSSGGGGR